MSDNTNETIEMTSETIAGDLIGALVMELKLMPDIWPRIGPNEQDEIIERIRKRVTDNVRQAVHLIASDGRVTVVGDLKKVLFSDKVEALFSLGKNDPSAIELTRCTGQACLIVVASAGNHMGGADDLKAERQTTLISGEDDAANKIIEQARRRSRDKGEGDTPQADA